MRVRYEPHGEKTRKTASLKHRINGKQKKKARPTARKIVKQKKERLSPAGEAKKCKKEARRPWATKDILTEDIFFHGRNKKM
ncbi:hypothetical protein [Segatella maculosa]|uniref:hypothetical protein n=1 Tax=Segatella maculosa TaxID=439703 RepID=UPI00035D5534|nr:hypothetical protein [Segatella maculosa]